MRGAPALDLVGQKYGRLTVLSRAPNGTSNRVCWNAQCDCGTQKVVSSNSLRCGRTLSCGCLYRERVRDPKAKARKHGMCFTPTWHSWNSMVQRCTLPSYTGYERYGGAGITVCDRWLEFAAFRADMGDRPAGTTIDRIDNSKGYAPGNCRWATPSQQSRNRSISKLVEYQGRVQCVAEWCEELGLPLGRTYRRLSAGYTTERAFNPERYPSVRKRRIK